MRQLDFLNDIAERYHSQAIKNGISIGEATEVKSLLLETYAQLWSWNAGLDDLAEYLLKRVQALVQTMSPTPTLLTRLKVSGIQWRSPA